MHFPAPTRKQRPKAMHDSRQHSVKQYRRAQRDFNMRAHYLCVEGVEQETGPECQHQDKGKRQRHGPIKHKHGRDINMCVVHPVERRNKKLRDLCRENEKHQDDEENHLRPVTTKTSSSFDKSTAGFSCAWPSSSRTRKLFTAPPNRPAGNTPPTPEVSTFCPGCKFACLERKLRSSNGVTVPITRSPVTIPCSRVPSTFAATRQFSSDTNNTMLMARLTVVVFPTKPSSVTTGMSGSMPSPFPRLIVTVRHQVEESRVTTSAGTNLNAARSR